jgi:hypothetical protein
MDVDAAEPGGVLVDEQTWINFRGEKVHRVEELFEGTIPTARALFEPVLGIF